MRRGLILIAVVAAIALAAAGEPARHAALQASVSHIMAGHRGAAVVLDVATGEILAAYHLEVAARRLVPPGSSLKPFTLVALLENGELTPHTALMCKRTLTIAGRSFDCTHPATTAPLDPAAALAYSCNSYFAQVATRLTPAQLRDALTRDGFTALTGLASPEAAGTVQLAQSPEQLQLQAIGEWGVDVTPLELASAYRKLALRHDAKRAPVFDGLEQSVRYGMAHSAQTAAIAVAGKTGTAIAAEGAWTHGWFAGYAPAGKPEVAVVVFLERGHGADAAALAAKIFAAYADATSKPAAGSGR